MGRRILAKVDKPWEGAVARLRDSGLASCLSADGLRWRKLRGEQVLPKGALLAERGVLVVAD